ncbi:MAG TPA: TetR/AcrR family transcriptional regulator [Nocardioidaceae bacterium]|nr:TetR/AcrR family transcriptional regulator [Nocardioidaceae bacterium]
MAQRGVTRTKVLATARLLFQRQGYHATGVNQILEEADAPKGSLYFHFPGGKQQLATEAVTLGAQELGELIDAVIDDAPDPASAVRTIADLLAKQLEDSDFLDGCPITTVALEAGGSDPIRDACRAGYDRWLISIADAFVGAGLRRIEATELAMVVLSTIEGGLLLARTRRDAALLRTVAAHVADQVAAALLKHRGTAKPPS